MGMSNEKDEKRRDTHEERASGKGTQVPAWDFSEPACRTAPPHLDGCPDLAMTLTDARITGLLGALKAWNLGG